MDIQAILPQITNAVNLSSNSKKCGDEFDKLLQQVNEETDIAEMYDTAMLEKYDMHGGRNVIISKKALLRMKKDSAFRQKVYKSIKDIPWSNKLTGGVVKGNGVFIHEDGTGGYYLEFDWGDEDERVWRIHGFQDFGFSRKCKLPQIKVGGFYLKVCEALYSGCLLLCIGAGVSSSCDTHALYGAIRGLGCLDLPGIDLFSYQLPLCVSNQYSFELLCRYWRRKQRGCVGERL